MEQIINTPEELKAHLPTSIVLQFIDRGIAFRCSSVGQDGQRLMHGIAIDFKPGHPASAYVDQILFEVERLMSKRNRTLDEVAFLTLDATTGR